MGTSELLGKPDEMLGGGGVGGGSLRMDWHPIQRRVVILLDTSCNGNRDKLWLFGPKGFSTDKCYAFTLLC